MGADGTEDNVSVKICSDTNDLCCENVMKKNPSEDWRQAKKQEWLPADFGDCKNLKFKVNFYLVFSASGPFITVILFRSFVRPGITGVSRPGANPTASEFTTTTPEANPTIFEFTATTPAL
jgi:hypothetical protein